MRYEIEIRLSEDEFIENLFGVLRSPAQEHKICEFFSSNALQTS